MDPPPRASAEDRVYPIRLWALTNHPPSAPEGCSKLPALSVGDRRKGLYPAQPFCWPRGTFSEEDTGPQTSRDIPVGLPRPHSLRQAGAAPRTGAAVTTSDTETETQTGRQRRTGKLPSRCRQVVATEGPEDHRAQFHLSCSLVSLSPGTRGGRRRRQMDRGRSPEKRVSPLVSALMAEGSRELQRLVASLTLLPRAERAKSELALLPSVAAHMSPSLPPRV